MSSKRILRSVLVAVVALGLAVGSAGAAAAAPERGEGTQVGLAVGVGEWVDAAWGWLVGERAAPNDRVANDGRSEIRSLTAADTNNGQMDPNG